MRTISTKQDILDCIAEEREYFRALVNEVGEDRMKLSGAMGEWTFHDLIAHLTIWWRWASGCLEAVRRDEKPFPHPSPANVAFTNELTYHTNRYRPLELLLRDADDVWEQFEEAVRATSEPVLLEAGRYTWYGGEAAGIAILRHFVQHYHNDHKADVVAWLARVSQAA